MATEMLYFPNPLILYVAMAAMLQYITILW